MKLRVATLADQDLVFSMAQNFIEETEYKDMYDVPVLSDVVTQTLLGPSSVVILYEDKGMVAGRLDQFAFGLGTLATEIAWWVDPSERNSGVGKELIWAFEEWAKSCEADYVVMVSLDEQIGKYYEKTGYKLAERMYIKEL